MIDFDKKIDEILYRKWFIMNTLNGRLNNSLADIGAVLSQYLDEIEEGRLKNTDMLADLHFLADGSEAAFEWFYRDNMFGTVNREEFYQRYVALNNGNKTSVGPMFLHFLIAKNKGFKGTYQGFRFNRRIGNVYLPPMLSATEADEAEYRAAKMH